MNNYSNDLQNALSEFKSKRIELEKQELKQKQKERTKKKKEKIELKKLEKEIERIDKNYSVHRVNEIFDRNKERLIDNTLKFFLDNLNNNILPPYTFETATKYYSDSLKGVSLEDESKLLKKLIVDEISKQLPKEYTSALNVKVKGFQDCYAPKSGPITDSFWSETKFKVTIKLNF